MDQWRPHWFSLQTRWMILTTTFLMVIFSAFGFLVYQNSITALSQEAKQSVEQVTTQLSNELSRLNRVLTKQNATDAVRDAILSGYESKSTKVENSLLSELGQHRLYVYVYDGRGDLILKSRPGKYYKVSPLVQSLKFKRVNNIPGFIMGKKIVSKKTGEILGYIQVYYELTDIYKIRNKLMTNIVIFIFIAFFLALFCSAIISSYFLKPIQEMIKTMKKIQADPIAAERTPLPKQRDELRELTEISNTMIDQIQSYIERQGQFVQDASHELRTPVAVIEGHLNMLNRWGKDDPEILEESISASLQEIKRMKTLVEEMLDLSRVDEMVLEKVTEKTPIIETVKQVASNLQMIHPSFKFDYKNRLPEEKWVKIQRNHLEQLLIIFLDNAVKYSTNHKEIRIKLSCDKSYVSISIQDFGEGIASEDIDRIFDRFYRVDKARSRSQGGNGLGLSIAKRLIDAYHGTLNVESTVGVGTEFTMIFPTVEPSDEFNQ